MEEISEFDVSDSEMLSMGECTASRLVRAEAAGNVTRHSTKTTVSQRSKIFARRNGWDVLPRDLWPFLAVEVRRCLNGRTLTFAKLYLAASARITVQ